MRKKLQKLSLGLLLCGLLLGLAGCRQVHERPEESRQEESRPEEAQPASLVVFQEESCNPLFIFALEAAYPEISFQVIKYNDNNLKEQIAGGRAPDLILGSCQISLQKLAEDGIIADITAYYKEDENFNSELYYPGVSEVGRVNDVLYAFPLGLETNYMTLREETFRNSAFAALPENYTIQELLQAMLAELDAAQNSSGTVFNGILPVFSLYDWLWDSGALQVENGKVFIDQELFDQIIQLLNKQYNNVEQVGTFNAAAPVDPTTEGGQFVAAAWGANGPDVCHTAPQIGLVYAQSANRAAFSQETYVLWRPMKGDSRKYAARVGVWGMVGKESDYQELVYEMLRAMMDMPVDGWISPGERTETVFPVNRENALLMLKTVENTGVDEFSLGYSGVTAAKEGLDDRLRQNLTDYLENIVCLYESNPKIDGELQRIFFRYQNAGSDCYEEILDAIQKN